VDGRTRAVGLAINLVLLSICLKLEELEPGCQCEIVHIMAVHDLACIAADAFQEPAASLS
jgi:hypothetical protein